MNQRLQELVEQAGFKTETWRDLDGTPTTTIYKEGLGGNNLEKFAELIIQDCMDVVDGYTKPRTFNTHYDAVEQIEALFGIKHNGINNE